MGLYGANGYEAQYRFDAWGNRELITGATATDHASTVGYRGQLHDAASGDIYLRNRYYEPGLGRFTSPDPIGYAGGLNLYAYPEPVNNSDITGLCPDNPDCDCDGSFGSWLDDWATRMVFGTGPWGKGRIGAIKEAAGFAFDTTSKHAKSAAYGLGGLAHSGVDVVGGGIKLLLHTGGRGMNVSAVTVQQPVLSLIYLATGDRPAPLVPFHSSEEYFQGIRDGASAGADLTATNIRLTYRHMTGHKQSTEDILRALAFKQAVDTGIEDFRNLPDHEKSWAAGRVTGHLAIFFVPSAKLGSLEKVGKLQAVQKLSQTTAMQRLMAPVWVYNKNSKFVQLLKMFPKGTAPRNWLASEANWARLNSARFYSIQGVNGTTRLLGDGTPWPTGLQRANMGEGLYVWPSKSQAQQYMTLRGLSNEPGVNIMLHRIPNAQLQGLRALNLTTMSDTEVEVWMGVYSHYGAARPHSFEHVIRTTGNVGDEHFFSRSIFNLFQNRTIHK